jgi:hypothetical protein
MRGTKTRGETHTFTPPANWDEAKDGPCGNLSIRCESYGERDLVTLVSTWKPSAEDIAHFNRGGVLELSLITTNLPPAGMRVVDPVVADAAPITINEEAHGNEHIGCYDEHGYSQP